MIKNNKTKKGFTLTEVLIVVLIIGVFMAIAYPVYNKAILKSRAVEAVNLLQMVRNKQISNMARNGQYAQSFVEIGRLTKGNEEEVDFSNGNLSVGSYTLTLNEKNDCVSAQYHKRGSKTEVPLFAFSASYAQAGLGCDGSICSSFGNIIGTAGEICKCADISCKGGQVLDLATCTCKTTCDINCKGGQVLDKATCTCKCPAGQCLSGGLCLSPNTTCTIGQQQGGGRECPGGNGTLGPVCQAGCPNKWVDGVCTCKSGYQWDGTKCMKNNCADGSIQKRSCDNDYAKVQTRTFKFLTGWSAWEGCCDCNIDVGPGGGNAGL